MWRIFAHFFSTLHCHHSTQITCRTSHNFFPNNTLSYYIALRSSTFAGIFYISISIVCHSISQIYHFGIKFLRHFFHVFVFTKLSFNLLLVYGRAHAHTCVHTKVCKTVFFQWSKRKLFSPSNNFQLKWLFRTTEIKIKWPRRNEKWTGKRERVECVSRC